MPLLYRVLLWLTEGLTLGVPRPTSFLQYLMPTPVDETNFLRFFAGALSGAHVVNIRLLASLDASL